MISVAMATYNGAQYILEQLESIYSQARKVDEIVIVDDGSADDTVAIIHEYMKNHPDCCIKFFENEVNLGYRGNFRRAISLCEGDIIFLCDQDDVWMKNKVEVLSGILENHPEAALVSSSFMRLDSSGQGTENKKVYNRRISQNGMVNVPITDVIFHNISQGCAMAFRKELKDLYLDYFSEELPHDWILNIIAAVKNKCYFLNVPLFFYRIHDKNTIGLNDNLALKKKNTLKVREHDALQAIRVLDFIAGFDYDFYRENPFLDKMKVFSEKHVEYLEHKNLKGIICQNFNANYRKLKTVRGRMLDIFFVINKQ